MKLNRMSWLLSLCVCSAAVVAHGEEGKPTGLEPVREGASKVQDAATGAIKGTVDPIRDKAPMKELDAKTSADIRSRLSSMVNNATSVNGFDDLVGSLSKADRDRIAENRFKGYDKLNAAVSKFRDTFRSAYGVDFDFKSAMLDDLKFFESTDKDHATVKIGAISKADANIESGVMKSADARAVGSFDLAKRDKNRMEPPYALSGDEKKPAVMPKDPAVKGDAKALEGLHLEQVQLSLVNEGVVGNGWRVDLPNPSAEALSASLIRHLEMIGSLKGAMPKDPTEGHRFVAHHIFQALVDAKATPPMAIEK